MIQSRVKISTIYCLDACRIWSIFIACLETETALRGQLDEYIRIQLKKHRPIEEWLSLQVHADIKCDGRYSDNSYRNLQTEVCPRTAEFAVFMQCLVSSSFETVFWLSWSRLIGIDGWRLNWSCHWCFGLLASRRRQLFVFLQSLYIEIRLFAKCHFLHFHVGCGLLLVAFL